MASRGGKRPGAGRPKKGAAPVEAQTHTESPVQTQPQEVAAVAVDVPVDNPFHLTPKELLFVEAYFGAANFIAVRAYELAGYSMAGRGNTKYSNAVKVLGGAKVAQAVAAKMAAKVSALKVMTGEEALQRLSTYARADIGHVLGENDAISKLPPEVRQTIKAVRETRYGRCIELYDAMRATELLAKADGKLKEIVKVESLEELIAASMQPAPANGAAA